MSAFQTHLLPVPADLLWFGVDVHIIRSGIEPRSSVDVVRTGAQSLAHCTN